MKRESYRLSTEEFIKRSKETHGDKYDYSRSNYINKRTKVCIICPEHGEFWQAPQNHMKGQGCPKCGIQTIKNKISVGLDNFIKRAHEIHGDKYDFSMVKSYNTNKDKILIKCNECGNIFTTTPNYILNGHGCKKCSGKKYINGNDLIKIINEKYDNDSYLFPNIKEDEKYWINDTTVMVCKKHGPINKKISNILKGTGCGKCEHEKNVENLKLSKEEVEKRLKILIRNKLSYNINDYINTQEKIEFTCLKCGHVFKRDLNAIMYNQNCPQCKKLEISKERTKTTEEYIAQCKKLYDNLYDYSNTEYVASDKKVTVKCNECGKYFSIEANSHLQGHGCPNHYRNKSKIEEEIFNFVKEVTGEYVIQNYREIEEIKEIDIYIPKFKIGIELNGLYWHNELNKPNDYHLKKTLACESKGIRLIHIFEDEWIYKQEIIKSMLRNIFNKTENKIYARKCKIKEVNSNDSSRFLDTNHLQGKCGSSIKIGLYYNNDLVSLMVFGKSRHFVGNGKQQWELLRFCNRLNTNVIGGASKLLKYFIEKHNPENIVSYADRRWSLGKLYNVLGFEKYNNSKPNYYYVIGDKRIYRFNLRKSVLIAKYGCPKDLSEHDFCKQKHWYRIYDCGCLCYIWNKI